MFGLAWPTANWNQESQSVGRKQKTPSWLLHLQGINSWWFSYTSSHSFLWTSGSLVETFFLLLLFYSIPPCSLWHPTSPVGVNPVVKSRFICSVRTFPDVTSCLAFPFVLLKPETRNIKMFYLFLYFCFVWWRNQTSAIHWSTALLTVRERVCVSKQTWNCGVESLAKQTSTPTCEVCGQEKGFLKPHPTRGELHNTHTGVTTKRVHFKWSKRTLTSEPAELWAGSSRHLTRRVLSSVSPDRREARNLVNMPLLMEWRLNAPG